MCGEFSKFFRCKHSYIDLQSENKYVCLKDSKKINEENKDHSHDFASSNSQ